MRMNNRGVLAAGLTLMMLSGCGSEDSDPGAALPKTTAKAPVVAETVDPEAVDALRRMSAYLMSLKTAEITSNGSLDVVTEAGQRVQMDGVTNYKIRRPGFSIDFDSDQKKRRFIYDGKTFTVYAPVSGFYASVPAPPTNRETLAQVYEKFGVALPLEDMFRWSEPGGTRSEDLKSAFPMGTATIDGVATDHYAFREDHADWEVWIQQGDQPVPRKLVIVDRTDDARPTFTARLDWKANPAFTDGDFTFTPDANAKRIRMAKYETRGE
jgi:hypothetical protein